MNDPQRPLRRLHLKLSRGMNRVGSVFLLLWLAFWSAGVLFFDGCAVWLLVKNVAAQSYPSVAGEITVSEPAETDGSARWKVQFRYSVEGRELTGDRRTFAVGNFSNRRQDVPSFADQFVVGKPVEVFYNPSDPSDSAAGPNSERTAVAHGIVCRPIQRGDAGRLELDASPNPATPSGSHSSRRDSLARDNDQRPASRGDADHRRRPQSCRDVCDCALRLGRKPLRPRGDMVRVDRNQHRCLLAHAFVSSPRTPGLDFG